MPYFGPGIDNSVNLTPSATLVFTPISQAGVNSTVRLVNQGTTPVYVGGAGVTPFSGLKLTPNARVELPTMNSPVYACGGYGPGAGASTTLSGAVSAGATVLTLTTAASFSVGSVAIVGNASGGQEAAVVTGTTATAVTLATALVNDHATGVTVATGVVNVGLLRVGGGTSGVA